MKSKHNLKGLVWWNVPLRLMALPTSLMCCSLLHPTINISYLLCPGPVAWIISIVILRLQYSSFAHFILQNCCLGVVSANGYHGSASVHVWILIFNIFCALPLGLNLSGDLHQRICQSYVYKLSVIQKGCLVIWGKLPPSTKSSHNHVSSSFPLLLLTHLQGSLFTMKHANSIWLTALFILFYVTVFLNGSFAYHLVL